VGLTRLDRLKMMLLHDSKLSALYLNRTRVTGAGLVHLIGLHKLSKLGLYFDPVTDAGLAHLKCLTELTKLSI
jgi:hypothetical protein